MYLDNLFEVNTKIKRLDKCTGSYNECYHFWSNSLFERSLHLFHWNSGDTPEHEVEKTIMINGCTGIAPFRNKVHYPIRFNIVKHCCRNNDVNVEICF